MLLLACDVSETETSNNNAIEPTQTQASGQEESGQQESDQPEPSTVYTPEDDFAYGHDAATMGIVITRYIGQSLDVVVPAEIDGRPVTKLSGAFRNSGVATVQLPDTLKLIGDGSFKNTKGITTIIIPNSVTEIGDSAFKDSSISSIIIPDSVTHIGNSAFEGTQLTSIIIPDSVAEIGDSAFKDSSISSIIIPDSVTHIGRSAFSTNTFTYSMWLPRPAQQGDERTARERLEEQIREEIPDIDDELVQTLVWIFDTFGKRVFEYR